MNMKKAAYIIIAASLTMCVGCSEKSSDDADNTNITYKAKPSVSASLEIPYNIAIFHNEPVRYGYERTKKATTATTTVSLDDNNVTIKVGENSPRYCYIDNYEIMNSGMIKISATDGKKYLCSIDNVTLIYDESEER